MKQSPLSELGQRIAPPPISWLMKLALERRKLISLAAGFTDSETLPVEESRELLDGILSDRKQGRKVLQYGSNLGDGPLRRLTWERLVQQDGLEATDEARRQQLIVTHGSQQLLYLVAEALCDPEDIVLVEAPTYFVFLSIAQSRGLVCRSVALQADGLDVGQLESVLDQLKRQGQLHRLKMLYSVTYFQNPSGVTTSFEKKGAALDLLRHYERAAGHPIYFLEDAAYRDLQFAGAPVRSALGWRKWDRVIYTGTYSKPFATGVRVGFGYLPEPLFTAVSRIKGNHDFGTSNLLQALLGRALSTGAYDRHLPVLQARYRKKARCMTEALRRHLSAEAEWFDPAGGICLWLRLAGRVRTGMRSACFRQCLAKDVLYVPGELCYASDSEWKAPRDAMRLSFGAASEGQIREGIRRLGAVVRAIEGES